MTYRHSASFAIALVAIVAAIGLLTASIVPSSALAAKSTAAGNNVYITWWERNATSNEPVLRVSNDYGKTFGEKIMLSNNATTAKPLM